MSEPPVTWLNFLSANVNLLRFAWIITAPGVTCCSAPQQCKNIHLSVHCLHPLLTGNVTWITRIFITTTGNCYVTAVRQTNLLLWVNAGNTDIRMSFVVGNKFYEDFSSNYKISLLQSTICSWPRKNYLIIVKKRLNLAKSESFLRLISRI